MTSTSSNPEVGERLGKWSDPPGCLARYLPACDFSDVVESALIDDLNKAPHEVLVVFEVGHLAPSMTTAGQGS
jgi:hypothetical protein